ncbi:MAG: bifunctional glutamate N-acetyltransferase/amino-acid acetyltransferase ArgJ [Gammaproteobacteria bacterium]|nr:bifunctional glutamate N-acetyltransferase/amino-acid acetyltransferase ArgJ [Gammaproteobacteria bacterium]
MGQVRTTALAVPGFQLGTAAAGIRYSGRDDLVLIELPAAAVTGACFTRNRFCAAPVVLARRHLDRATPGVMLINAGNANAGTGAAGMDVAVASCRAAAAVAGCAAESVLPFSTGVIGEALPLDRLTAALPAAWEARRADGWQDAAAAIMTTDTVPKLASVTLELNAQTFTVTGMAKGSGMICPDLATMLAFVVTDAPLDAAAVDAGLKHAVARSFNRITVDGDTSTNDAVTLTAAPPQAGTEAIGIDHPDYAAVTEAVTAVCEALALAIVRDGEGATHVVKIQVAGARTDADADTVARTVAGSPLVKTAMFAADPNWGRILAAVGRAPIDDLSIEQVGIRIDDLPIVADGEPSPAYDEAAAAALMARETYTITVLLGNGSGKASLWTCDLSHDYVSINADYRS